MYLLPQITDFWKECLQVQWEGHLGIRLGTENLCYSSETPVPIDFLFQAICNTTLYPVSLLKLWKFLKSQSTFGFLLCHTDAVLSTLHGRQFSYKNEQKKSIDQGKELVWRGVWMMWCSVMWVGGLVCNHCLICVKQLTFMYDNTIPNDFKCVIFVQVSLFDSTASHHSSFWTSERENFTDNSFTSDNFFLYWWKFVRKLTLERKSEW